MTTKQNSLENRSTLNLVFIYPQKPNLSTLIVKDVISSCRKTQFLDNTFLGADLMVDITGVSVMVLTVSVLIKMVERSGSHVSTAVMERQNAQRMVRIMVNNIFSISFALFLSLGQTRMRVVEPSSNSHSRLT